MKCSLSNLFPGSTPSITLAKFKKLGIHNRFDLVLHLPSRYEDETRISQISELKQGTSAHVEGTIIYSEVTFRPRRSLICQLQDHSGIVHLRFLNFYPTQQKQLKVGERIRALGEVRAGYWGMEMVHPKCRSVVNSTPLKQTLTPVYPTTAGLQQTTLHRHIQAALNDIELSETLPKNLLSRLKLSGFADSIHLLHNPPPDTDKDTLIGRIHPAWQRIKFDELLAQQLSMRVHYRQRLNRNAPRLKALGHLTRQLLRALPFSLTAAQQNTYLEISHDLEQPYPMQRLLQGDVGSGKTIVALLAALQAIENGYQVALMAPTEILAEQHYHKLCNWLFPLGISPAWLSGSLRKKEKQEALNKIAQGGTQLAIGTHALFQNQVLFPNLGLIIVDEQHKFGVQQRLSLRNKGGEPHQLMMSATPIPRTLAMSYYTDLDISVIDELPPGRTPVITKLVHDNRRDEVLERIHQACLSGQQAYWICPLIDGSDTLELQTVLETHQHLVQALPDLRVDLIHGKLDAANKTRSMTAFKMGETHLLIATTVIEVGVDVPNASIMVIEHAERMGLAQLHQLRGRIGRGTTQSLCILLFQEPLSELARARLKIIYENTDGFEIARQDLNLRGPGELLGARQHGIPMLRFADITQDTALLQCARTIADEMLCNFQQEARAHLQRWVSNKQDYLYV